MIATLPDLLFPYLIGIVSSVVLTIATLSAFVFSSRRAISYMKRESRLPEATRWEDLTARVQDLELDHDRLKDDLFDAKKVIEEGERQQARLTEIEETLRTKEQDYADLQRVQADYAQVSEQLAADREEGARLSAERAKAEFERDALREDSQRLETRLAEQGKEAAHIDERIQGLRSTEDEIREEATVLRQELGELRTDVAQLKSQRDALATEIERISDRHVELQEELRALKEESERLSEARARLGAEVAELEVQAAAKREVLNDILTNLKSHNVGEADAEHVLKELWVPAINPREYGVDAENSPTEQGMLGSVRQYLQNLGLQFPDRVVNAFHTSLKCADDTPLLVLAGISGTGKSLLPRRYSEAMGIHFLNTPVQPRWDGPQDLLGFYNYLENRYKATELLRALLQFDPVGRSWTTAEYEDAFAHEHLLLVLLDEMNLARIEYYFSEFLSRLETRRDIPHVDRTRPSAVRKAEIPIEVGRLESIEHQDPVRLFVDSNVLFVGTINEDESTLSLSDKVVDRANIMRFGRPRDLSNVPKAIAHGQSKHRARHPLTKLTWLEWIEAGAKLALDETYEAHISKLNDALALVGRPFGYRTRRAILTYLRMYPDRSGIGLQNALADQVEQRVLPKLRGIDVTERQGKMAIEDVVDVIRSVEDTVLLDAVERGAAQDTGHLFVWSGVDRTE